ncbi:MAG TPA: hypothetical protein VGY97_09525, partial [Solirubrobacteraceae bacterium]|nr:hypothetical protein [Solirubrobacteraceae bacterium]
MQSWQGGVRDRRSPDHATESRPHGAAGRGSNGPTGQRWRPRGATRALGAAAALLIWLIAAAGPARAGTY